MTELLIDHHVPALADVIRLMLTERILRYRLAMGPRKEFHRDERPAVARRYAQYCEEFLPGVGGPRDRDDRMVSDTKTKALLRLETNGPVQRDVIWRVISRLSLCRSLYLSLRYKGVFLVARGTRLRIGSRARVTFEGRGFLCVGFFHLTPTPASLHIRKNAEIVISGTVQLMRGTRITVWDGGRLRLGSRTYINDCATITCFEDLRIGSGCAIAWNTNILDTNIHELSVEGVARPRSSPVNIGDHVWIGTGVTILAGTTIGTGAVIAAGSVVTSDVPVASLVAGNPAKVVREDITWEI